MVTVNEFKYNPDSSSEESSYGCGGALISRRHILSAAHCAKRCKKGVTKADTCEDKEINWAILGDHDKRKHDGEIYIPIIKPYHIHPKSKQPKPEIGAFSYDYVIFTLDCCVSYNDYIQPICLPKEPHSNLIGNKILVSGWGKTKYRGALSPILKSVDVEIISDKECADDLKAGSLVEEIPGGGYKQYLLCAGDTEHWSKDACQHDSGGKYIMSRRL